MRNLTPLAMRVSGSLADVWPTLTGVFGSIPAIRSFYIQVPKECYYHGYQFSMSGLNALDVPPPLVISTMSLFVIVVNPTDAPGVTLLRGFSESLDLLLQAKSTGSNRPGGAVPDTAHSINQANFVPVTNKRLLNAGDYLVAMMSQEVLLNPGPLTLGLVRGMVTVFVDLKEDGQV